MIAFAHGSGTCCLNTVNFTARVQSFDRHGNAGSKSAAADGNDNSFSIGEFLINFKSDGSLSGNDLFIIKGMNKDCTALFGFFSCGGISIVIDPVNQHNFCAIAFGCFHFGDGSGTGNEDFRFDLIDLRPESHALSMVSGRTGDHTAFFIFVRKFCDFVISSAHLERSGDLKVFGLDINVGINAESGSLDQRSRPQDPAQLVLGIINFINGKHDDYSSSAGSSPGWFSSLKCFWIFSRISILASSVS